MAKIPLVSRVYAKSLIYRIGTSNQWLIFSANVIEHFIRYQQRCWRREAGGQLFARLSESRIEIELATGPRPTDRRTWTSYVPDRLAEQEEILWHHDQGLHFVGDWHTHRQARPQASPRDGQSMAECVRKSIHNLRGFVLVIVGTDLPPAGLAVSLHDGFAHYPLSPVTERELNECRQLPM